MASSLYPNCVWAQMLAPKCEKYEDDTITQYWVMSHFNCINLCARVTLTFDLFIPKLGHVTGSSCSIHVPNFECMDRIVFEICGHKLQISWHRLLGNRCCHGNLCHSNRFVQPLNGGVVLMSAPVYEVDRTTQYWVMAHFKCITLCGTVILTFDLFTPKFGHWLGARVEYMHLFWSL